MGQEKDATERNQKKNLNISPSKRKKNAKEETTQKHFNVGKQIIIIIIIFSY